MTTPSDYTSLRQLIKEWALPQIGATLADDDGADADITPYTTVQNLFPYPDAALVNQYGFSGLSLPSNLDVGELTSELIGSAPNANALPFGMRAGGTYTFAATAPGGATQAIAVIAFAPSLGSDLPADYSLINESAGIASASGVGRVTVTFTIPADAYALNFEMTADATDTDFQWSEFMLAEGDTAPDYFDGNTPVDEHYTYAWDDTPSASSSTRTPINPRSADSLTWSVGQTLWDFLQPLFTVAGLRLYCDEARVWHLVDPDAVSPGEPFTIAPAVNLINESDTLAAGDPSNSFDAVLVTYTWSDATGQHTAYDYAGPDGTPATTTYQVTYQRPYPGAGAAAYILGRAARRAGSRQYAALTDYGVQPYRQVTANGRQGVVASVSFDLAKDEMTVTTEAAA
ncbi:hypothetical protein GCM10027414_07200 [Humibacter ginsengiterrae]